MNTLPNYSSAAREALWLSAEHWLDNWQAAQDGRQEDIDTGSTNCACCHYLVALENGCQNCPIYDFTHKIRCHRTPYKSYLVSCLITSEHRLNIMNEYRFLVCLALGDFEEAHRLCDLEEESD